MKRDLTTARAVVETATQECNTLLDVIAASTTEVEAKKEAAVSQEKTLKVPGCSPMLTVPIFPHVSANFIYMQVARMALVACSKPHITPNQVITCGTETHTKLNGDRDIYFCRSSLTVSQPVWS